MSSVIQRLNECICELLSHFVLKSVCISVHTTIIDRYFSNILRGQHWMSLKAQVDKLDKDMFFHTYFIFKMKLFILIQHILFLQITAW